MNNLILDFRKINELANIEGERFRNRTHVSQKLLDRAKRAMPAGVPMSWMQGLYRHSPPFAIKGKGAYFEDADNNQYLDMNQADLSGALGFAPEPIVEPIASSTKQGTSFLLPTEDGIVAAELLAERVALPMWQFTLSASGAVSEAIRLSRLATGRERILMFEGKYHGHLDDTLTEGGVGSAQLLGLSEKSRESAALIPFNDISTLAESLHTRKYACLIAEPMLTNCNLVFPEGNFWLEAKKLCRETETLLVLDEAHTFTFAFGGLTREWSLKPDIVILGKGLGTGIPFGAYGMTAELAELFKKHLDIDVGPRGLATGGTMYANALSLAVARTALESCLTRKAYAKVQILGKHLSSGLNKLFQRKNLAWMAPSIGGRSAWVLNSKLPRNAQESQESLPTNFIDTRRLFMANRGIWEAIASAGPACSFAHVESDVDSYLNVASEFIDAVIS